MINSKCFNKTPRVMWVASFLTTVCMLGFNPALADKDSDSVNDSVNKVGNNFGELLKGMGQEIKKVGKPNADEAQKDEKKEQKPPQTEPDKNQEKYN